ncbi:retrotransposon protein [Cucumis melo var. makuwa]|uniref:Retrotransposon protein n=1 Tax=Cucumis melo var. makuwa TaxID=1194695 RepID=A0A5A7U5L6_CUCMM|nr:retrotransposon protein [Cucumis melo var. makuwa]
MGNPSWEVILPGLSVMSHHLACCLLHNLINRKMTNVDDLEEINEEDSTYATTVDEDIHYIETLNKWTQWQAELTTAMFNKWQLPKGLLNKSFFYYEKLAYVFKRDRATSQGVETFADIGSNDPSGYKGFQMLDRNDIEIPTVYNQVFNMSQDDVWASRPCQASNNRTEPSGSKQKRGGQHVANVDLIHDAMEYANDQLRAMRSGLLSRFIMKLQLAKKSFANFVSYPN